jgi:hypothetical protein
MIFLTNCKRDGSIQPMREWNMRFYQRNRELWGLSGFGMIIAPVSSRMAAGGLGTTGEMALSRETSR